MKYFLLLSCIFFSLMGRSQLLPHIGLTSLPADNEPICNIPLYTGNFDSSGYDQGQYAADFTLYDLAGNDFTLSQKLTQGKPVLLIGGNLTCPVFRNKIPVINDLLITYPGLVEVAVIYTVEAHPTDISPYFGYVNITNQNINAGITFPQPLTYADRKTLADTLSYWSTCNAPIYLDGPCNEWWSHYGPAPNNAYLIQTNGLIDSKHGWFDKFPRNIYCDLDTLLGVNSGKCTSSGSGQFQLQILNASVSGTPSTILYDYARLINPTTSPIIIGIKKIQSNLPSGWQTAFCADVCYSPTDDSITLSLPPLDTLDFSLDFITTAIPDSGNVKVGFRNVNDLNNGYSQVFKAYTSIGVGLLSVPQFEPGALYPNPAGKQIHLKLHDAISVDKLNLFGITGVKYDFSVNMLQKDLLQIDIQSLPPGMYFLKYQNLTWTFQKQE